MAGARTPPPERRGPTGLNSRANLNGINLDDADFDNAMAGKATMIGAKLDNAQLTAKQIASARNVPTGLKPKPEDEDAE